MIIDIPGDAAASNRKMVEFLLPRTTGAGEAIDMRYIMGEIERIAAREGGATALKAPVEGLWAKGAGGEIEKDQHVSFFTVIDITGREQSIGEHLLRLKRQMEEKFGQEDIFILASEVQRI
ncbi:MAG: hypothetical protein C4292_05580 [Nitrososphaera sp.]